jgi:diguanylate cyclase (GGDEF)-like protein
MIKTLEKVLFNGGKTMSQQFYILISFQIVLMSICIVIFVIGLIKPYRIRRSVYFLMICLFIIGWFFVQTIGIVSENTDNLIRTFSFGLVFLQLASSTLLLFNISYYQLPIMPPRVVRPLFYVFPAITVFFALTPFSNTIVIVEITQFPRTMADFLGHLGPWFWIHSVYCFFFIMFTLVNVLYGHTRVPKFYRFPSVLLVLAIVLIPLSYLVSFTGLWALPVPAFSIAFCAAIVLTNFALANNDENIFIRYARGSVFQYMNEYILVLGKNGIVVDSNPGATALFKALGINPAAGSLGDIIDKLIAKGATIKPGPDGGITKDISITSSEFPLVLNLSVHEFSDKKNQKIGSIAVFSDVSGNRALLDMLEEKAGLDPLTGIANRTSYVGAKNRFNMPEHLPLSVIICDINGLKVVNDSLGHKHGDKLIQIIAKVLESRCPKSGFLARIGGDEFILLLSRTDENASNLLIKQIRKELQIKTKETSYDLSLALGTATKYSAEQDLDEIIDSADSLMYKDKNRTKN